MKSQLLVGVLCADMAAIIRLFIRPCWSPSSQLSAILLGSLPNFLAVLGLALILLACKRLAQQSSRIILLVLASSLAYEVVPGPVPSAIFTPVFDWHDVVASVVGAMAAHVMNQQMNRSGHKPG